NPLLPFPERRLELRAELRLAPVDLVEPRTDAGFRARVAPVRRRTELEQRCAALGIEQQEAALDPLRFRRSDGTRPVGLERGMRALARVARSPAQGRAGPPP